MEEINRWSCTNNFNKKISSGSYFPIGSCCQPWLAQAFFYCLHETAACCYFGADLGKGLDFYSLSRLADGTPYSSSDLPYFKLLLPFKLDEVFEVQLPFPLLPFWSKKFPSPIFLLSSLRTKIFQVQLQFCKTIILRQ